MEWDAILALGVALAVMAGMLYGRIPADMLMVAAMAILLLAGVLNLKTALLGFSNENVLTIALLYVLSAGLTDSGALAWFADRLLGGGQRLGPVQWRLALSVSGLSSLMNNTPIVAMMIPAIQSWCRRTGRPPSALLLLLSYAAILGGTVTLLGTSTNLVVNGLIISQLGRPGLGFFEITPLGLILAGTGLLYLLFVGNRLLPQRDALRENIESTREYAVRMRVEADGPIANRSIEAAGLRRLGSAYLTEVERDGILLTAVGPDRILQGGDLLTFIGSPESAGELQTIPGLTHADASATTLRLENPQRVLLEAVLSNECPYLNQTVRQASFRSRYGAAILAINREGRRLQGKIGDVRLLAGDALLLESGKEFAARYRNHRDFLLLSPVMDAPLQDFRKAPVAIAILAGMVLAAISGLISLFEAALATAGAMLLTGCVTPARARSSIDISVILVIAASFAVGQALLDTGAVDYLARSLMQIPGLTPWTALAAVYLITALLTEQITNNAAAVLMFPIAAGAAEMLQVSPMPFAMAILFAASASFLTPIGYQTNLMVYGPGGYRMVDYLRVGGPLQALCAIVSIVGIPLIWPFSASAPQ